MRAGRTLRGERAILQTMQGAANAPTDVEGRRQLLAEYLRWLGERVVAGRASGPGAFPAGAEDLLPRMRQTLEHLLAGDSEKQIAVRLGLSRHTVHVYVKGLYKRLGVSSRGELMAKFVSGPAAGKLREAE